jgi:hypothetical protein
MPSSRDPALIDAVWQHGRVMPEADPAQWRQDACGAWMRRDEYGREADFGWKLERFVPGGPESADSLRPFHWRNGYDISTGKPHCRLTADRANVPAEKYATPPRNRPA